MKIRYLFFLCLFIIFSNMSCKKYSEDTNSIHLRTIKERLCRRTWFYDSFELLHPYPIYSSYNMTGEKVTFDKNGTSKCIGSAPYYLGGEWTLSDDKNYIEFHHAPNWNSRWEILRLDGKKLTLQDDSIKLYLYIPNIY